MHMSVLLPCYIGKWCDDLSIQSDVVQCAAGTGACNAPLKLHADHTIALLALASCIARMPIRSKVWLAARLTCMTSADRAAALG